jgi:hypothetical protein
MELNIVKRLSKEIIELPLVGSNMPAEGSRGSL